MSKIIFFFLVKEPLIDKNSFKIPFKEEEKEVIKETETSPEPQVRKNVDIVVTESVQDRGIWYQEDNTMMAALIAGTIAGIIFATLVILLCVHRIRKKDQGSYPIEHNQKLVPKKDIENETLAESRPSILGLH